MSSAVSYSALAQMAKEALKKAYAPYSGCRVGAALLTSDGKVFTGCNIENSSFTPTCCAERTAIFKAVSEGHMDFEAIAVAGEAKGKIGEIFPPCGVCLQVMTEFCDPDSFKILLVHRDGYEEKLLGELLPTAFGRKYMQGTSTV